jgi:hypothetical protein
MAAPLGPGRLPRLAIAVLSFVAAASPQLCVPAAAPQTLRVHRLPHDGAQRLAAHRLYEAVRPRCCVHVPARWHALYPAGGRSCPLGCRVNGSSCLPGTLDTAACKTRSASLDPFPHCGRVELLRGALLLQAEPPGEPDYTDKGLLSYFGLGKSKPPVDESRAAEHDTTTERWKGAGPGVYETEMHGGIMAAGQYYTYVDLGSGANATRFTLQVATGASIRALPRCSCCI